jgi:hypothetical protein
MTPVLATAVRAKPQQMTDTQRTATEQLLVSAAVDQAVSQLDFRILAGKSVYFEPNYLQGSVDHGYVVSSLRQHLLACGCLLQEDRGKATYVVEARAGAVGTDVHQLLFGVPQMNLPAMLPGQPSLVPEIPLAKRTDQNGVAKLAVFAYNRVTGRPVWQSGVVQMASKSQNSWLFGLGPFRRGTFGEDTEIVGQAVAIPLLSGKEADGNAPPPVIAVTQCASWDEPPATLLGPLPFSAPAAAAEQPFKLIPAPPSVETIGIGASTRKVEANPGKAAGDPKLGLQMDPILVPDFGSLGGSDSGSRGPAPAAGTPVRKDADTRKGSVGPPPGNDGPK